MKRAWITIPALVALATVGCSANDSGTKTSASKTVTTTGTVRPEADDDDDEPGAGVRIPLGQVKEMPVPADAVMDIKTLADWAITPSHLSCVVTDGNGKHADLMPPGNRLPQTIRGQDWATVWTFAVPPAQEISVGCRAVDTKLPETATPFIRVVPRGLHRD